MPSVIGFMGRMIGNFLIWVIGSVVACFSPTAELENTFRLVTVASLAESFSKILSTTIIVAGLLVTCSFQAMYSSYSTIDGDTHHSVFRALCTISFLFSLAVTFTGFVMFWSLQTLPIDEKGSYTLHRNMSYTFLVFWQFLKYSFLASILCIMVAVPVYAGPGIGGGEATAVYVIAGALLVCVLSSMCLFLANSHYDTTIVISHDEAKKVDKKGLYDDYKSSFA